MISWRNIFGGGINMFCPQCATENRGRLNYCRGCGLKLDAVIEAVADQMPANEDVELHRRRKLFERAGAKTLSIAGLIAVALVIFFVTQYEALGYFFGVSLFGATVAWIWLVLTGLGIRAYPQYFMKSGEHRMPVNLPPPTGATSRLIEDRHFEPAPRSVTEHTTDLLQVKSRRRED